MLLFYCYVIATANEKIKNVASVSLIPDACDIIQNRCWCGWIAVQYNENNNKFNLSVKIL